jgi:hypothetical protein
VVVMNPSFDDGLRNAKCYCTRTKTPLPVQKAPRNVEGSL